MYRLSKRSLRRLTGLRYPLADIVKRAITITKCDFAVIEGLRSLQRQKQLKEQGASWTLRSRHLTGHAVDLGAWVNGTISWQWQYYPVIAKAMMLAAQHYNAPIVWGGQWRVRDGVHFELDRNYN